MVMSGVLFGLHEPWTDEERKLLYPLLPGATMEELSDRLIRLENLRYAEVERLLSHKATAPNFARYEEDVTWIGIHMESTALRIKAKAVLLSFQDRPLPQAVRDLVESWGKQRPFEYQPRL